MSNQLKPLFALLIILIGTVACQKSIPTPAPTTPTTTTPVVDDFFTVYYDLTTLPTSTDFASAQILGSVQEPSLNEISGIAAGTSPGTLWCEEDSSNPNNIYLMKSSGEFLGTVRMTSISDRDWEDMCIAPGPNNSLKYIYLAEIGDNNKANADKFVFRFPEPVVNTTNIPFNTAVDVVDKFSFSYPDGIKNAEAMMVDPLTKDLYIVSKESQAVIYVARYPQDITKSFTMTKLGVLPITDVTAADISPDGKEILIKNYTTILYWKKSANESIWDLLKTTPVRAPYQIEEKGESICWAADGSGYFTTSELPNQPIYFYKRK